jgi:hypothetical protein
MTWRPLARDANPQPQRNIDERLGQAFDLPRGAASECATSATGGFTMARLTEKKRDSLKDSTFGLPEEHKYPMPDESHARNAKARASQQVKKGNLTRAEERKIDRKADKILKD